MEEENPGICVICGKRKARPRWTICHPCDQLTRAEGTRAQLAAPSPTDLKWQRDREQVAEYNKLVRAGWGQESVAQHWGRTKEWVRVWAHRRKKDGHKVVNVVTARRLGKSTPATEKVREKKPNEHGGGKYGVRNCKCEPCATVRRVAKREANRQYRLRKKQQADKPL